MPESRAIIGRWIQRSREDVPAAAEGVQPGAGLKGSGAAAEVKGRAARGGESAGKGHGRVQGGDGDVGIGAAAVREQLFRACNGAVRRSSGDGGGKVSERHQSEQRSE